MYIPRSFAETRTPVLHDLMDAQPLAALVTLGKTTGLFASHLPLLLDRTVSPLGRLTGHLSRANTQWQDISPDVQALAIFAGPQHYISPSWYPEKADTGKVVPTWNYAVVHAYAQVRIIEDAEWLRHHLESLTNQHETGSAEPWRVADAPPDYIAALIKGIVGVELSIDRLEGKWKTSQNRPERDRHGVVAALESLATPESLAMKTLVERGL